MDDKQMTLQEFLLTANADHAIALQQARDYEQNKGRFITSNTLTVYVVQLGLYSALHDIANTADHAARDMCMAVMYRLRSEADFNFIVGSPMGDANLQMFDALITLIPAKAAELTTLKGVVTAYCNELEKPFAYISLHTVLTARGVCPTLEDCTPINGYFVIENTAVCERHSPNLYGQNPRTGRWIPISRFPVVDETGLYELPMPAGEFTAFKIDNAYGVLTCLKTL